MPYIHAETSPCLDLRCREVAHAWMDGIYPVHTAASHAGDGYEIEVSRVDTETEYSVVLAAEELTLKPHTIKAFIDALHAMAQTCSSVNDSEGLHDRVERRDDCLDDSGNAEAN